MISNLRCGAHPSRLTGRVVGRALASLLLALCVSGSAQAAIDLDFFVRIGDPGNPGDSRVMNDGTSGWGSVPYEFEIGAIEITNLQYMEFLSSVATYGDPNGLWHPGMCREPGNRDNCSIQRTSSTYPTSYIIQPGSGAQQRPVTFVNVYDAMRFANWLHNGMQGGSQGRGTTEDGAYTIAPGAPASPIPRRNPGARYFVPNEDEWYKAAYYDPETRRYFLYPTQSDAAPTCSPLPGSGGPYCDNPAGGPVQGGGGNSPYRTQAQGGNVSEWTERQNEFEYVTLRGGSFADPVEQLQASANDSGEFPAPSGWGETPFAGFRIARALSPVPQAGARLMAIGSLGDISSSGAEEISADGSTVVGFNRASDYESVVWTEEEGLVSLGESAPPQVNDFHPTHFATDASDAGSVVVGERPGATLAPDAFRWTEGEGFESLGAGDLNTTDNLICGENVAAGVSADGSVVAGSVGSFYWACARAFRWSDGEGAVALEYGSWTLSGPPDLSRAGDVSADGDVVVGAISNYWETEAFRWKEDTGMVGLGDLPGGVLRSEAYGVSADGAVVVGSSSAHETDYEAFRWTAEGGMVGLGDLTGGYFGSEARAVSGDGAVVVGYGTTSQGPEAFVWDAQRGMRSVREMLEREYGLDLTGWYLTEATGISSDGRTIVGNGQTPAGVQGWVATLPAPAHPTPPAPPTPPAACSDGGDNDGDGLVDFPADPGCRDESDDSEYDAVTIVSPTSADAPLLEAGTYAIEWTADAGVARADVFWKGNGKKTSQWTAIARGATGTQISFTVPKKVGGQRLTFMVRAFDRFGQELATDQSEDLDVLASKKNKKGKKIKS
jgi:probable HAF family extracellular repeat protein